MNAPHRGGKRMRSRARCMSLAGAVERASLPRKSEGLQLPRGTCECAAEVIVGIGVLTWKSRTAAAQDRGDPWRRRSPEEQFLGDPFISDAPVGLRKAF